MIEAELHGKLKFTAAEHLEDVLTSSVFGFLKLLPFNAAAGPWLGRAVNVQGQTLEDYWNALGLRVPSTAVPDTRFWPTFETSGVPDVLLILPGVRLLVEAKYLSGKSGEGEDDQPARYMKALVSEPLAGEPPASGAQHALVYVTCHRMLPRAELEASAREAGLLGTRIFWTSWTNLWGIVHGSTGDTLEARVLTEVMRYLRHKGFVPFEGWARISDPGRVELPYRGAPTKYTWNERITEVTGHVRFLQ